MHLICKWCGETKSEELMVKRNASKPYSQSNTRCCRQCHSVYQRARYGIPEIRAKQLRANSAWRKAHPDQMARYAQKLTTAKPNQQRARDRVHHLLRRGGWSKQPCAICGAGVVEAHHDSYAPAHWETVRWLCKAHHERWHQMLDPVKKSILDQPLKKVTQMRDEAAKLQRQITVLREKFRVLNEKANALELSAWNKVVEAADPLFERLAKAA